MVLPGGAVVLPPRTTVSLSVKKLQMRWIRQEGVLSWSRHWIIRTLWMVLEVEQKSTKIILTDLTLGVWVLTEEVKQACSKP